MDKTLERILYLMKEKRMTAVAMEELLGVPHGAFSNWKRGKGKSYYEHIERIADLLGVSIDYLVRGEDVANESLSQQEAELLRMYRQLSDDAKDVILKNVRLLL